MGHTPTVTPRTDLTRKRRVPEGVNRVDPNHPLPIVTGGPFPTRFRIVGHQPRPDPRCRFEGSLPLSPTPGPLRHRVSRPSV